MLLVSHAHRGRLDHGRCSEREKLGTAVAGGYFTEERMGVGIVDDDWQEVPDLAGIAVEDDDPVAMRAAGELKGVAMTGGLRIAMLVRMCVRFGGFAGAFDQDLNLSA